MGSEGGLVPGREVWESATTLARWVDLGGGDSHIPYIYRCLLCNKILTRNGAKLIGCKRNNVVLNLKGAIIPKHEW